jgi:hypothetical protein
MAVGSISSRVAAYTAIAKPAPPDTDEVQGVTAPQAADQQPAGIPPAQPRLPAPTVNSQGQTTGRIIDTFA